MTRKSLPRKLEKTVYQQFRSRCPFCGEDDVNTLQVHHIVAHAEVQSHHIENLLLTCANCHQKIENGAIAMRAVYAAKFDAEKSAAKEDNAPPEADGNVVSFTGTNLGTVANNVSIHTKSVSQPKAPIRGSIGSDLELRNYAKYLIDRYHEFKKAEVGKGAMKYPVFYAAIKREFGANWDHIPVSIFDDLVAFLHRRIDGTRLGRTMKAQGKPRYSSFEQHRSKATSR